MNESRKRHAGSVKTKTSFLPSLPKTEMNSITKTKANTNATPPMIFMP
jgi:hypothetical protein